MKGLLGLRFIVRKRDLLSHWNVRVLLCCVLHMEDSTIAFTACRAYVPECERIWSSVCMDHRTHRSNPKQHGRTYMMFLYRRKEYRYTAVAGFWKFNFTSWRTFFSRAPCSSLHHLLTIVHNVPRGLDGTSLSLRRRHQWDKKTLDPRKD